MTTKPQIPQTNQPQQQKTYSTLLTTKMNRFKALFFPNLESLIQPIHWCASSIYYSKVFQLQVTCSRGFPLIRRLFSYWFQFSQSLIFGLLKMYREGELIRFLACLRWWSIIDENGNEKWMFESYDQEVKGNPIDSFVFWYGQIATFLFWTLLFAIKILTFSLFWVN